MQLLVIYFVSTTEPVISNFVMGFSVELRIIRERVRSGMANAASKGVKIGRPHTTLDNIPAIFLKHYPSYKNGTLNVSEFARVCDMSRTTIYKYVALLENKTNYI